jgi:hypothetical protein
MKRTSLMGGVIVAWLLSAGSLRARTITLTADDCDQVAIISAEQPRLSWSGYMAAPGIFSTYTQVNLYHYHAILVRFPLDKIPKDQRITKAEWTIPVSYVAGPKPQFSVHRLLAEWGTGVCHQYRLAFPKKVEWNTPGAKGVASDRANQVSAVFRYDKAGSQTVDVTQDIELWYTGAVPNRGWILSLERDTAIYLSSPYPGGADWKLQITFEPK